MQEFEAQVAKALRDALVHAIPDTPSGSHRILVVGQIVVNIHNDGEDKPRSI